METDMTFDTTPIADALGLPYGAVEAGWIDPGARIGITVRHPDGTRHAVAASPVDWQTACIEPLRDFMARGDRR
jgi:hypothetical protein